MRAGTSLPADAESVERAVILLGRPRSATLRPLEAELGIPVAALPIDAERGIVESWLELLAATGWRWRATLAVGTPDAMRFYERIRVPTGVLLEVVPDPMPDRGPAGVVRDLLAGDGIDAHDPAPDRVLVIEGSRPAPIGAAVLAELLEGPMRAADGEPGAGAIRISVSADATPAGAVVLDRESVRRIASIGFVDLKEQLVNAVIAAGGSVRAIRTDGGAPRIRDRIGYLREVAARLATGAPSIGAGASVHPTAAVRGASLVARDGVVGEEAFVMDSVVLPGARVGARAVVARSIVPPGVEVPASALVVDEVFAPLRASGGRSR